MSTVTVRQMKPMHLYAQITRKDAATREVEGIFYANAKVGDGFTLPADTVERMLPDYMKFGTGAIRAMHQPVAAGQALRVWMDKDADGKKIGRVLAKVTDDDTWKKVDDGTYKGYSIGVIPTVLRGETVKEGKMPEISFVDRPWDEDAVFTSIVRMRDYQDIDTKHMYDQTYPVVVERAKRKSSDGEFPGDISDPDELERAVEAIAAETNAELRRMKMKKLRKAVGKIAKVKSALNGGGMYYAAQPMLTRGDDTMNENGNRNGNNAAADGIDWRARALAAEQRETDALARLRKVQVKLAKKVTRLSSAEAQLAIYRGMPAAARPVRYPDAANRSFEANGFDTSDIPHFGAETGAASQADVTASITRYRKLIAIDPVSLGEQQQKAMATEVAVLTEQLATMGVDATQIF